MTNLITRGAKTNHEQNYHGTRETMINGVCFPKSAPENKMVYFLLVMEALFVGVITLGPIGP